MQERFRRHVRNLPYVALFDCTRYTYFYKEKGKHTKNRLYCVKVKVTMTHKRKFSQVQEKKIRLKYMTKAPTLNEKFKKQRDNTKTPPQNRLQNECGKRVWTDLGRSVGVTTATKLVWLNRLTGSQPSQ